LVALTIGTSVQAEQQCRLALALALDVSSSVDAEEYVLQSQGLAKALTAPDVMAAILAPRQPPMALAVYEWSGRNQSTVVLNWTILNTAEDVMHVAEILTTGARSFTQFPTAMGFALGFGANLMQEAPTCDRQVIDISGDGITNDGFRPKLAYKHFEFSEITVNGLAVLGADDRVLNYFLNEVRHGPGAFVETAEGYAGFHSAMARKLMREINSLVIGQLPADQ
jgi:hypothetical protein